METNNKTNTSFVESFKSVEKHLYTRYMINMHLDFIQEFVKFADNTRSLDLQNSILLDIQRCERSILNIIKDYERKDKTDTNTDSN